MPTVVAKYLSLIFFELAKQFDNERLDSSLHGLDVSVQLVLMVKLDGVCFLSHLK